MQVYLPEELYRAVKDRRMRVSELLQEAVRAELRREQLLSETDRYVEELVGDIGEPSVKALAGADRLAQELKAHSGRTKAM